MPYAATRRSYNLLVGLLVVLACLSVVVTGTAIWVHFTVLNTDRYVEIVAPLAEDPETLQALSDYVAGEVVAATGLRQRTGEALPDGLSFLSAPITEAVDTFIARQTYELLGTEQAYQLWLEINRSAHTNIVRLLRGETSTLAIEDDQVMLNTLPLISAVLVRIDRRLPDVLATRFDPPVISPQTPPDEARQQLSEWLGRPLAEDAGQVTLLTSDALGPAQTAVKWLDRLAIILPVVTAALVAVAIWLSRRRRRTIIELGVGAAAALIVLRVVLERAIATLMGRLEGSTTVVDVVQDLVGASVESLSRLTVWVAVVGGVVAAVAWLIGRSDVTEAIAAAGGRTARASSPLLTWCGRHADLLRIGGLVVGLVVVVLFSWTWLWLVVWLVLAALYQVLVSWLAGSWPFARGGGPANNA